MRSYFLLILFLALATSGLAQSSDDLFKEARSTAFDKKDYPKAISLCKKALAKSPDYSDIRTFMGRLYTWSDKKDSATMAFKYVLAKHPDNEDAVIAYTSLEYWDDNYEKALEICNGGLQYHSKSIDLLLLKAKVLIGMKDYKQANEIVSFVLAIDYKNTAARALAEKIKDQRSKNKIGISYDFVKFDKQFSDPWHLASLSYTRQTRIGSIIGRVNYANRFKTDGAQFEIDAYPHISKTFYAYMNAGYSNNVGVFSKYRAGFSLYANLPKSFEADAGFRYLYFSSPTWIYTAAIGKYYKNYRFSVRTFQTPSNSSISQSYSLNIRYYFGGADDYFSLTVGTGISPDDPRNNVLLNTGASVYKLRSNNLALGYHFSFRTVNTLSLSGSIDNQEYRQDTFGNQFQVGISYQRRF